ncbi:MAG: hypothetical protein WC455_19640 [Dehalococcoidia bacterium]|jgi:hypothetical protein
MFGKIFSKFDGTAFSHTLIARKAERKIGEFLDSFGAETLKGCIEKKIWMTDCLPIDYQAGLKQMCAPYIDMLPAFPNEEVYTWIPLKHRAFMEALPGGKQWALGQLQVIREYLSS